MTLRVRELERQERRVLGALRCVDAATLATIATPLQVEMAGARVQRNRSGLYVIVQADALAAHEGAFDAPPAEPAPGSITGLEARIADPGGTYLPRRIALALPRDPDPAHAAASDSLFRAIEVPLYPAAIAPTGINWAVLRVTVREQASGDALGGALLIARSNGTVLGRALSDWRGEALLGVAGVPVTTWSDDPDAVVVTELQAQLEAVFAPADGTRTAIDDVRAGRSPAVLPGVDPDRLEAQRETLPRATLGIALAAARTQSLSLSLALP
jgi:hypothetical protein